MIRHLILTPVLLLGFLAANANADVIASEDFDGGALNLTGTVNVFDFGAGGGTGGDVFGRVSPFNGGAGTGGPFDVWDDSVTDMSGGGVFPGDTIAVAGQATTAFFAMNDANGNIDGSGGNLNNAVWTFNIASAAVINDVAMDIGAFGDFEASSSDGFLVEARIDGNAFQTIFQGIVDEAASKTYRAFDDGDVFSLNDPLELFIDGAATGTFLDKSDPGSGLFDTFTSTLLAGQSGSTLDIRISWAGNPSGSEPMGFDNFTINGSSVPEPGTAGLLGLTFCCLAMVRRRRR